jgi:inhibitor of KinA sporulation pathway (predicted exonuclease)
VLLASGRPEILKSTGDIMRYVIADLEATCWEKGTKPARMEIIEIGAVMLPSAAGEVVDAFAETVRPVREPVLSDFCLQLTGIRQSDVDRADTFLGVFPRFVEWIGPEAYTLCSWGAYDLRQFRVDCKRHGIPLPEGFEQHLNLKQAFADLESIKPCGMKGALRRLEIPLEGRHHRAIDDARNIAKIARIVLPRLEDEP